MLLRPLIVVMLLTAAPFAAGTPLDTGHDLIDAVAQADGGRFLQLLSAGLAGQLEAGYERIRDLAEADPALLEEMLASSGIRVTPFEVQWMTFEEFVSRVLQGVTLPSPAEPVGEDASLQGRNADVLFTWYDGTTLALQMVWEESAWRITGSPQLPDFLH